MKVLSPKAYKMWKLKKKLEKEFEITLHVYKQCQLSYRNIFDIELIKSEIKINNVKSTNTH